MHNLFVLSTANSKDPDERLYYRSHNAAFHQGLHCLLRKNIFREKNLEIETCDPSKY